jgi:predicted secreted hydrolase
MPKEKSESKSFIENLPVDITPKDDAFHGSIKRLAAEWWYFDTIFDNGYAIHIGCMTFSKKQRGNVSQVLEIYKDGKLISYKRQKHKFKSFMTSKEIPSVIIDDEEFIEFDNEEYKKNGKWIYYIKLKLEDKEVDLKFIGTTKGWKIETDRESWSVATPKATVSGNLILEGKKINVNGIGYHDHNWNYSLLTLLTYGKGWYWGRIMSKKYNLTFVNIFKSHSKSVIISIINEDEKGYFNVDPKKIIFEIDKFIWYNHKKIPTKFILKMKDTVNNSDIDINILSKTNNIHFEKRLLFMSYWRFHINSKGYISINSNKEFVNENQIIELLKFR